jgi:hypothetical protein
MNRATHALVTGFTLVATAAQPQTFTPQDPEVLRRTDLEVLPSNSFGEQRVAFSPDRVELASDGTPLVSHESPRAHDPIGHVSGGIVVRSTADGRVIAAYDVYGVTGLAIAPDSRTFVYATGAREIHRARARLPR